MPAPNPTAPPAHPANGSVPESPVVAPGLVDVDVWIFDLDNTLYPASCNLFPVIERRMGEFIADRFGLPYDEARRRQKRYFREYGTTLRGLMIEDGLDPLPYLEFVHTIDLSPVTRDPALERALARLPGRKLIFTNASRSHAEAVTARLGIAEHFEAIHDIVDAKFLPKPDPRAYADLVRRHAIQPARACMIEDMAINLGPAAALGMTTVWVRTGQPWGRPTASDVGHIHHSTDDLVAWLIDLFSAPERAAPS